MAGKFEISKAADGTFSFEFKMRTRFTPLHPFFKKRMSAKEA